MAANVDLLLRWLAADAEAIDDIVQKQIEQFSRRRYKKVIALGNRCMVRYGHSPYAILFDLWSARASDELKRPKEVVRHLLRGDGIYRRWERSIRSSGTTLTFEEKVILHTLFIDLMEQLELLLDPAQNDGFVHFLWVEYRERAHTLDRGV